MKSQLMTQAELARLQAGGKTLEQDGRGIKVTLLPDGNIFKLFKLRGFFTSSRVYSNARSFCRNAQRLQRLNIATVNVVQLYHFTHTTDTAVFYEPIAGETVKTLLKNQQFSSQDCENLGQFIAELHKKGVYFRSLHCGNIVKTASGFGLIDIADMKIYSWSLWFNTRLRNFKRLAAYSDDMTSLGQVGWEAISMRYLEHAKLHASKIIQLQQLYTN
jgi:serine/threonine protein kinase